MTTTLISLIANAGKADQAIATSGNKSPVSHLPFLDVQSEITQYHTFSALSGVLLDYRSEAHLSKKPCGLPFTKGSLVLMLIRCEHSRVLLLLVT